MADNFLIIRIHPDSPVDGGTFSTYLDGLQIKVYPANAKQDSTTLLRRDANCHFGSYPFRGSLDTGHLRCLRV